MYLVISVESNPDIDGGFWSPELVMYMPQRIKIYVGSKADASKKFMQFTADHDLGAGNCPGGGLIYDDEDRYIGRISYNGRIWGPEE